jgi:hypothetical protein
LDDEKSKLDRDVKQSGNKVADKESDYHILMTDFEIAKEREAVLMGDRLVQFVLNPLL